MRDGKAGREKQAARAAIKGKECSYKRKRVVGGVFGRLTIKGRKRAIKTKEIAHRLCYRYAILYIQISEPDAFLFVEQSFFKNILLRMARCSLFEKFAGYADKE